MPEVVEILTPALQNVSSDPATHAAVVTPSDSTDLANPARALFLALGDESEAYNLSVVTLGGETLTIPGLYGQQLLPIRIARVRATGTTIPAGKIIALW